LISIQRKCIMSKKKGREKRVHWGAWMRPSTPDTDPSIGQEHGLSCSRKDSILHHEWVILSHFAVCALSVQHRLRNKDKMMLQRES
jgi:hypothetical protein